MQRVLSPLNVVFNADFQKISAEIPFTPSYLEPWHDKGYVETSKTWQGLNIITVTILANHDTCYASTDYSMHGLRNRKWLTVTIF